MKRFFLFLLTGVVVLAACTREPPARKVTEFLDDKISLEAALTRCNADRSRTRDDKECQNAREAAKRISVIEEEERRRAFEEESQRKLDALRRRNAQLEESLRRAEEEAQRRAEELYDRQFLDPAPGAGETEGIESEPAPSDYDSYSGASDLAADTPNAPGNAATRDSSPGDSDGDDTLSELNAVREELERRSQDPAPEN